MKTAKSIIGRIEKVSFIDSDIEGVPARVDTGAYRSSVWATKIREENGRLRFTLLGPTSSFYNGKELTTTEYRTVEVENSFGHKQKRFSVFLSIVIAGRRIRSNFTLANREMKTYPALVGRKLLRNRFLVDVSRGGPLSDEETYGDDNLA